MKRYTIHDRKVHEGQTFGYRTGERWAILDRETNKIVDEGTTRYEAQQAVNNWNAGLHDEETVEATGPTFAVNITTQTTENGVTTAESKTVAKFDGENAEERAKTGYREVVQYHLPNGSVAALYSIDRRGDWHLVVRSDQPSDEPDGIWKVTGPNSMHTAALARAAEEIHHDPEGRCEWYALCPNPADGTVKHPVLGDVPTCQRCADRFELLLVKIGAGR